MDVADNEAVQMAIDAIPTVLRVVAILFFVWLAARFAKRLAARAPEKFRRQAIYLAPNIVWAFGFLILLSSLGININSLLALFATIGLGAALIFTPVGQGLIAGFLAGIDDVVRDGDVIEVNGRFGKVVRRGALSVGVEYPDGSVVYMPNVRAVDDELVNHTRVDGARIQVEIKLKDIDQRGRAVEIMEDTLESLPWRSTQFPTAVHFTEIGANALHYECFAWIEDRMDEPGYTSKMLTALVDALHGAGIELGETSELAMSNWPTTTSTSDIDLTVG